MVLHRSRVAKSAADPTERIIAEPEARYRTELPERHIAWSLHINWINASIKLAKCKNALSGRFARGKNSKVA